jgi:hypothetical protein
MGELHLPTASLTHFVVNDDFAAPASFLSAADVSQVAIASFLHFVMKLFNAAPASFFSVAWSLQVEFCAAAPDAIRQSAAAKASPFIVVLQRSVADRLGARDGHNRDGL